MQPRVEPLPEPRLLSPSGLYLITEDRLSVAAHVSQALQQKGIRTAILTTDTLSDPEQLAKAIADLRQIHGPVIGVVHLAALANVSMPNSISEWRQMTQIQSKSLFQILNLCAEDLQQAQLGQVSSVLAASLLGGYFGRHKGGSGLPSGGSSSGLLKCLVNEWPSVQAKALDFNRDLSPADIASHVVDELLVSGGRLEVGYPQGNRTIFETVPASLATDLPTQLVPDADWVVLVTGGARGITAEITKDLAAHGLTLIVTGRSAEPLAENKETAGVEDVSILRKVLIEQAKSDGKFPTPAQIERQLQQLLSGRAIALNLKQFRQAGAKVEYLPVDVRNVEEFSAAISGIYNRYGRLDAVIHGAGIIEDKLVADKSLESFERVFDTKVDSTFILSRYLQPESLKLLVLFSSVAGRYGSRGQSDYAAANEVLNRFAWHLQQSWPHTHVVAINWGPWDTTGMASEEVKRQFKERGIMPIPVESGRQFFLKELLYGSETEVIAGEGPWQECEKAAPPAPQPPLTPLLSSPPQLQANSTLTLEHTFSLSNDPYLQDHCLDGKAVLPAAGALEWIAEFVQSAYAPEWTVTEVRELKALRGLVIENASDKKVLFKSRASSHADSESLQVAVEIIDPLLSIPFYRASVLLRPQLDAPPVNKILPLSLGINLDTGAAYRDYLFHGPRFQLITTIDRLNEQGIDALVMPSQPSAWLSNQPLTQNSTWLFDPGLIDVAPQLAIAWSRVQRGTTALPSRFGTVTRYGQSMLKGPLRISLRINQVDDHTLNYDAVFTDENGNIRLHLKDIESTCNPALNRLANHQ